MASLRLVGFTFKQVLLSLTLFRSNLTNPFPFHFGSLYSRRSDSDTLQWFKRVTLKLKEWIWGFCISYKCLKAKAKTSFQSHYCKYIIWKSLQDINLQHLCARDIQDPETRALEGVWAIKWMFTVGRRILIAFVTLSDLFFQLVIFKNVLNK